MFKKVISAVIIAGILVTLSSCAGIQQKKEGEKKSSDAYYGLGVQYLSEGDYQRALLELRKAETFQMKDPRIHNTMGLVYYFTERYEEAEKEYRKAISQDKNYSEAYVNLGTLYARQDKYTEAIEQYKKALKNPFYATPTKALHNIGLSYQKMGNTKKAVSALQKAIQQDPAQIRPYFDLGRLYYRENRMEDAIKIFGQAIRRHPRIEEDPINTLSLAHLHNWLALSYFKNSDSENAVIHFREVERLSSDSKLSEEASKYLDLLR
ncbi:MAG: tetratricopeptide repeat protein [Candidatus Hydrothermarchaeaceae archaeon]